MNGLIIAVDTVGDGHYTEYPSKQPSVALQIPFKDGVPPLHRVIKPGPCDTVASIVDDEFPDSRYESELK